MSNGHVYPEVDQSNADLKYAEHKYLYRNLQNGRFEEVTDEGGPGILENAPARGCAFGDYDNDGDIDVAVNCINSIPQLLRCDSTLNRNWIKIKLSGVKSNRTGIGSRVTYCQDEARRHEAAAANGRIAQRRQLFFAERSPPAFWAGASEESRHGRNSLGEWPGRPGQRPCRKSIACDSGGRQGSKFGRIAAVQAPHCEQGLNAIVCSLQPNPLS